MVHENVEVEDAVTALGVAVPLLSEGAGVTVRVPVAAGEAEGLPDWLADTAGEAETPGDEESEGDCV